MNNIDKIVECASKSAKVQTLRNIDQVIGFFKYIQSNPQKLPKWIKEIVENEKDLPHYIECIYRSIKQYNNLVVYDIYYNKIDEAEVLQYVKSLFLSK